MHDRHPQAKAGQGRPSRATKYVLPLSTTPAARRTVLVTCVKHKVIHSDANPNRRQSPCRGSTSLHR